MKRYLTILFFVFGALNICKAQDTVKRSVTLLREKAKVDSFISHLIDDHSKVNFQKRDSGILLVLSQTANDAGYVRGLHAIGHQQIIFAYDNFYTYKRLGYFKYRGFLVFDSGDSYFHKFFTRTDDKKTFRFISQTLGDNFSADSNSFWWFVFYEKGDLNYGVH